VGPPLPKLATNSVIGSAVELILYKLNQTYQSKKQKVTILATGPLTNIAELVRDHPQAMQWIEQVVIMGGALDVPGNIKGLIPDADNETAEWNIYADPRAAEIVFQSDVPVTLVPLDATNKVPLSAELYERLQSSKQPAIRFVYESCKEIVDIFGWDGFLNEFYFWDLLTMAALEPKWVNLEENRLSIDVKTATIRLSDIGYPFRMVTGFKKNILNDLLNKMELLEAEKLEVEV